MREVELGTSLDYTDSDSLGSLVSDFVRDLDPHHFWKRIQIRNRVKVRIRIKRTLMRQSFNKS